MSLNPRSSNDSAQWSPSIQVAPLTREHAVDICTWRYAPPYECYDMQNGGLDWLLQPEAGFPARADGQVTGWPYDDMRPEGERLQGPTSVPSS